MQTRLVFGVMAFALWGMPSAAAERSNVDSEPALVIETGVHTAAVRRIAANPGATLVVTVSDDKTARVWELATGKLLRVLRVPVGADEVGRLYAAAISPDGAHVAVAGTTAAPAGVHRIYRFGLPDGGVEGVIDARGGDIKNLAWSPHGDMLAAVYAREPALRLFRADGTLVAEQKLPADAYGLSWPAEGPLAVTAFDAKLRVFRAGEAGLVPLLEAPLRLPDPVSVRHSPDGSLLAIGYFSRAELGGGKRAAAVDVVDASSGVVRRRFDFDDVPFGNLMNVAWSADGRSLLAAGTGYRVPRSVIVKQIGWPDARAQESTLPHDSVLDLAALPDGRVAFADFDGAWGLLQDPGSGSQAGAPTARFWSASVLRSNADASVVGWSFDPGGARIAFNLEQRRWIDGEPSPALKPADVVDRRISVAEWENTRVPKVAGNAIALLPNELSRAIAMLPDRTSFVLAAGRSLRHLDASGKPLWALPMPTETRAVNVSADGKRLVAAMADGTLRWRRMSDGELLLSLLPLRDGRWVLWTESGYFDASAGAEELLGWLVPRPGGERADYFDVSRFRDRYYRPDVIDRVLATGDSRLALAQADDGRRAAQVDRSLPVPPAAPAAPVAPIIASLPPVVTLTTPSTLQPASDTISIDYKVFLPGAAALTGISVRVDGRPLEVASAPVAKTEANGEQAGRVTLNAAKSEGTIQVFAQNTNGISAPATVTFRQPARPAPAPAPQVDKRPTLFLLAVGVSRYADPDLSLGLPAKDATDFAHMLEQQQGRFYKRVESRVMTDAQATRAAVLDGLKWLQAATTPADVGILFIAGHGVTDAADTYFFLPHDVKVDRMAGSAISDTQLRQTLAAMKGKSLFFVDTCFSGKSVGQFAHRDIARLANTLSSAEMGVVVFSASAPRQESLENQAWGNGAFTRALVQGLSGDADFRREGVVTHKGLDYFVAHEVKSLTQGRQTPVTAVPNGVSDFGLAAVGVANQDSSGATR